VNRVGKLLFGATIICLLTALGIVIWSISVPSFDEIAAPIASDDSWLLLKKNPAPSSQPILLVVDTQDSCKYARYTAEILRAEGILSFETEDISRRPLDSTTIHDYRLVIIATSSVRLKAELKLLSTFVERGGRLLAMAPPADFDSLLGVRTVGTGQVDGYLQLDSLGSITGDLPSRPIQFFGRSIIVQPITATILARFSPQAAGPFVMPAAGFHDYGSGRAGFFSFDLGTSVVITRQGRPPRQAHAQPVDRDGDGVYKTTDLFFDTFDYLNRAIPQADVMQLLLVRMVYDLLSDYALPRLWYFPDGKPCAALLTGDHHGQNWHGEIERMASYVESRGGRFTFVVYSDMIAPDLVQDLVQRGHDVEPHLYYPRRSNTIMRTKLFVANWFSSTYFFRPRYSDLRDEIESGVSLHAALNAGHATVTRTHYLIWLGWAETPHLLFDHGLRMDLSISGADPHSESREWNSPSGYGYINGSGRPMRFVNTDGNLIPCYTQLTQFEDDVTAREVLAVPLDDSVTTLREIELSKSFIDESMHRYHATLVWNFHPEHTTLRWPPEAPTTWPWFTATVDYLQQQGVPMMTSASWLRFTEARSGIAFSGVSFDSRTKSGSFILTSPVSVSGVTVLIPVPDGSRRLKVLQGADGLADVRVTQMSGISFGRRSNIQLVFNLSAKAPYNVRYEFE
jgi:hypothetical protein